MVITNDGQLITGEQLTALIRNAVHEAISNAPQHSTPTPDELLIVQEAAEFLKLSQATIYAMVQRRELPVSKRGGRLYFSKLELIEYVKGGRKLTAAEIQAQAASYVSSKKNRRY